MDPLLEERYLALLRRYRVGHQVLNVVKQELLRLIKPPPRRSEAIRRLRRRRWRQPMPRREQILRADAALCLLVLYDQMIARPYGQQLGPKLPVTDIATNTNEFSARVLDSFSYVSKELKRLHARPVSSHQVLRVIDRTWPKSAKLFGWG